MRLVVQRVKEASVTVEGRVTGAIERGFVVFVGVTHSDSIVEATWLAQKVAGMRLFEDDQGLTNLALTDVGGAVLVVSQFTLYADLRKGRRPSFVDAAVPAVAEPLINHFTETLRGEGLRVETGVFGAAMQVALVNDGPVTILLERLSSTHQE